MTATDELRRMSHMFDSWYEEHMDGEPYIEVRHYTDGQRDFDSVGDHIRRLLDEIEAEISERYMEAPLDADGVPIRIGDGLALQYEVREKPSEVESITFDGEDWYFTSSDGFFNTAGFHHVKPRTIEDVLLDAISDYQLEIDKNGMVNRMEVIAKYADEIRGMR